MAQGPELSMGIFSANARGDLLSTATCRCVGQQQETAHHSVPKHLPAGEYGY